MKDKFYVSEIFGPTVQGEGALCGQISHFIRFSSCSFRCAWCDSLHAVLPKEIKKHSQLLTSSEIANKIFDLDYQAPWITLTGGDPCIWELSSLVIRLHASMFKVAVETQGAIYKDWLSYCDLITVSPKGPSSGMLDKLDYSVLADYCLNLLAKKLVFKIVVFDKEDFEFAKDIYKKYLPEIKRGARFFISCGTKKEDSKLELLNRYKWLVDKVLKTSMLAESVVLPQLHVLLWEHELGR